MRFNAITLALGLVSIVGLSGCDDDDTTVSTTTPNSPTETAKYSVTAIDGYLRNARIWLDLNGNYALDDGEPNAISGDGGVADLDVTNVDNPEQYPVVVQAISGQTIDEDEPGVTVSDDYMMSAPPGEKDVTPLSTLVHVLIEQNTTDSDDAAAIEAAKQAAIQQVADQLGLDEDEILGDFVESGVDAAAYAAENLVDSNVLPSSPQELQEVAESEDKGTKFLSVTASVNNEIKNKIEEVAGDSDKTFDNVGGATEGVDFSNDTDDDGVPNDLDDFPSDPDESLDSDGDGIGNNADLNDDTVNGEDDIYPDANDAFPTDRSRAGDHDSDGVDSIDDAFPQDATEWADNDSDGYGDNQDVFDNDPTEWADEDNDGLGDNEDDPYPNDTDNDSYSNDVDAFPTDATEWVDADDDGVGNNADTFPNDPSEWIDSDSDGLGDNYENATEGLDPNNADSDADGVDDGEDLDPVDPTKWTTAHDFAEQEGTLYGFFSEWSDISNVDILFKETLNYWGDALTLTELIQYRGDQSFISLPLEAEGDLQLTENGWHVPAGYTIDFSGEQVIAYPEDNASLYYSVESEVVNLSGMALYEVYFEWFDFMEEARFAEGSQAVMFTFSPAVNQYFLWEGGSPYVRFSDIGYDTDGNAISSLDDIIVSQSVGESVSTDLTTSVGLYLDFDIELVSDGTAHYYFFDWDAGTASRVATADYLRYTLHGEDIIEFTVPVEAMPYMGEGDTSTMIFSMYNGELTVGEIEAPSAEPSDDTMYMFNGIAAQSIEDGVVLSDYLFTCYLGDSDDQSSPTMADYELAITDCGGRSYITSDMIEDLNFQRIKGNGDSRDYLFNADGTVHVLKGEGGDYTDNWEIVDGYIEVSYSDESESFTSYWALLDSLDGTWSIKFYEVETVDGQTSSYIWEDTVVQRERPAMLSACYTGDAEPVEGQPIPSMSDYETAIALCGGRSDITTEMIEDLNFQRVKGDGNTRDYLFNADGTVHVLKSEGEEYTDDWTIENGLIKVSYSDESESFTAYWALLESLDQTWSIKFFEEETVVGVSESWIWADTVVQQDRNALQFDPTNLVLMEQDDNNFFFHADGSMSYIGNDGTELYGNSWVKTSADTMMITYEDSSTEQWVLVSQTDDELTISREGAEEVLTNVTYEGKTLCESGDSAWNDITDQPSDFATRSEYDSAVANCIVGGAQFIESDFTGNGSESSRWELIDLWEINGTVMEAVEEEVVFQSSGTGYFENDEGLFSFNWAISSSEVTLDITASGFEGAKDIWNKVDQDGDNTMTKAFWSDPTWNNPEPAEGEAEITSGVMRFVGFEQP